LARAVGSAVKALDHAASSLMADSGLSSILAGNPCKGLASDVLEFLGSGSGALALACCGRTQKELVFDISEPLDSALRSTKARRTSATEGSAKPQFITVSAVEAQAAAHKLERELALSEKETCSTRDVSQSDFSPPCSAALHAADERKVECADKGLPIRLRRRSAPPAFYPARKVNAAFLPKVPVEARKAAVGHGLLQIFLRFAGKEAEVPAAT